jgi:hypothetical protein
LKALQTSRQYNEIWLIWIVVTGLGWVIGLTVAALCRELILKPLPLGSDILVSLFVGGLMVGLVQWIYLQPNAIRVDLWMLATTGGWTLSLLLVLLLARFVNQGMVSLLGGVGGGVLLGTAQWLVIVPKVTGRGDWVGMTVGSWTVALLIGSVVTRKEQVLTVIPGFEIVGTNALVGWTLVTLVVGVTLIFAFPKPNDRPFSG